MEIVRRWRCFDGDQLVVRHASTSTGTPMEASVYLPPQARRGPVPVVWFLPGLTCTWANPTEKAGFQSHAAELGVAVVCTDTSPRGTHLPGEHDSWELGAGAGYYVDATEAPWSAHYRMASWVTDELPALLGRHLPIDLSRQGITGHSMGGHGALVLALRAPDRYRSLSAFAPIAAPSRSPWGVRAFTALLGPDAEAWRAWDTTELIGASAWRRPVLVDQGGDDTFLAEQLRPDALEAAFEAAGAPLTLRRREGYDHSYYFVATFIGEHLRWHAEALRAT
ncbi:MAG TPA: S-formylglutathione hydrolase [Myxococcota bacterium]|nr:S-formylglutathione hydrolase [Myxococcota bacterium]